MSARAGKSKVAGNSATATTTYQKKVACYRYYYFLEKSSAILYFTFQKVAPLLFHYFSATFLYFEKLLFLGSSWYNRQQT